MTSTARVQAAKGADLVSERFDIASAPTESLLFSNPSLDADSPLFRTTVEGLVQQLRALPEVDSVVSYYDTNAPGMVSSNQRVVMAQVVIKGDAERGIGLHNVPDNGLRTNRDHRFRQQ